MWTYVLVLTISVSDYRAGFAINSINDFQSEQLCLDAGNSWLKHQQLQINRSAGSSLWLPNAICLPHKALK